MGGNPELHGIRKEENSKGNGEIFPKDERQKCSKDKSNKQMFILTTSSIEVASLQVTMKEKNSCTER